VRAQKIGSAEVEVPAGKFFDVTQWTSKFSNDGAEMKDAHFTVYLAKDAARTPVAAKQCCHLPPRDVELTKRQ